MNRIAVLFTALCCLFVACQKENTLKDVDDVCTKMDDSNFMKYCYDNFDVNHDGKVTMQEAAAVKRMDTIDSRSSSLKGIEFFTGLEVLICCGQGLTSLNVSGNKALKYIDCDGNNLTALDVSSCIELEELDCHSNKITSLDLSKNKKLKFLACYQKMHVTVYYSNGQPIEQWKKHNDRTEDGYGKLTWTQK